MNPSHHLRADPPGRTRPVRVLIADDHPFTRLGLRAALADPRFEVCAECGDADQAVAAAERERPDVCLLDVCMPGNGIKAAGRILQSVPGTAVVMVTAWTDDDTILDALQIGAVGILPKEMAFDRLPEVLIGVLHGEAAVPRDVTARLLGALRSRSRPALPAGEGRAWRSLTSRERDVLELLLEGCNTNEIRTRLFLSAATVRSHVAALLRKFGVHKREALLALLDADRVVGRRTAEPPGRLPATVRTVYAPVTARPRPW